jgi:hypothetical protein
MSSKKVLTAINIICFIIFVLIQSLLFFLNGLNDVIFYIGTYLLTSIIYLIPQAFIILQGKKQKSKPSSFSKTIDKASKYLLTVWVVILFIQTFIIFIFAY